MRASIIDIDELFDPSRVINNAEIMDKTRKFTDDGLYSPKIFGSINGNDIEYSCSCNDLHGQIFEGQICPECNSEVTKQRSIISRVGWIDTKDYKLIHPRMYKFISQYLGASRLKSYINKNMPIDVDGNIIVPDKKDLKPTIKDPMPECIGMGVTAFIENFDAILETFRVRNKDEKKNIYDFIRQNRSKLFITKIPVYSPRLRPVVVIKDKVITDPLNEKYVQILKLVSGLHSLEADRTPLAENAYINKIQSLLEEIDNFVILALNGKKGLIRNMVLGSRLNFSSRCVITPLPARRGALYPSGDEEADNASCDLDEIHMPYIVSLELFKLEVLNYLRVKRSISYFEAITIFNDAINNFNEEIYNFMSSYIGEGRYILLNRNPTIAIGSFLCMRITKIKPDISDVTMSIRNNILKFLSADYDGDVLNVYLLYLSEYMEEFQKFSPVNLVFSLNDGKFNTALNLDKDYALAVQTLLL